MKKKRPKKWVITVEPERAGSLYFGPDGKPTNRSHAMEFWTWNEAKKFADSHGIEVTGAVVSIVVK